MPHLLLPQWRIAQRVSSLGGHIHRALVPPRKVMIETPIVIAASGRGECISSVAGASVRLLVSTSCGAWCSSVDLAQQYDLAWQMVVPTAVCTVVRHMADHARRRSDEQRIPLSSPKLAHQRGHAESIGQSRRMLGMAPRRIFVDCR